MKVTFIGHASILIEANGVRILSDPWWNGPCFGAQWWLYPDAFLAAVEERPIDYIYISHGHHDHFHPPTLRQFAPRPSARSASR
jgi:L-ascorbate metabolism protein UlaG (beta-lactamase superfamily)